MVAWVEREDGAVEYASEGSQMQIAQICAGAESICNVARHFILEGVNLWVVARTL